MLKATQAGIAANALDAKDPSIIDTLNKAILEVLALPDTKKLLLDLGIEAKGSTPAELGDKLKADMVKWTAIIEKSGIEKQ